MAAISPVAHASKAVAPLDVALAIAVVVASTCYGALGGWNWSVLAMTGFFSIMAAATAIDIAERRVPNRLSLIATLLVPSLFGVAEILESNGMFWPALAGGLAVLGIFLVVHLVSPEQFGMGDVKLAFAVGMASTWSGFGDIRWLLFWTWLGLGAVAIVHRHRGANLRLTTIPFVPVLTFGATVTVLIGAS